MLLPFDYVFIVSGALCCLGSLAIIVTYIVFRESRTTSYRLLLYLSLCDLGQGLFFCAYMGDALENPTMCLAHHIFGVCVALSSFIWTVNIAYYVYAVITRAPDPISPSMFTWFHCIAWGYPLFVQALFLSPLMDYVFQYPINGGNEGWFRCINFTSKYEIGVDFVKMMLLLEFELPLIIAFSLTALLYFLSWRAIDRSFLSVFPEMEEIKLKMVLIPVIFMFSRMGSLCYVLSLWMNRPGPIWLLWVRAVTDPCQGLFNGLLFTLFSAKVRRLWARKLFHRQEDEIYFAQQQYLPGRGYPPYYSGVGGGGMDGVGAFHGASNAEMSDTSEPVGGTVGGVLQHGMDSAVLYDDE